MIRLEDLDPVLQDVVIAVGAKQVFIYCTTRQTKKRVQNLIPEEFLPEVQIVVSGRIRTI